MAWTSRYDTTFVTYANRKYKKNFSDFDSFSYWLFFTETKEDDEEYYIQLEQTLQEYCKWQVERVRINHALE